MEWPASRGWSPIIILIETFWVHAKEWGFVLEVVASHQPFQGKGMICLDEVGGRPIFLWLWYVLGITM